MDPRHAELEQVVSASALLGYLNFSNGRPDPRWQKQLDDAYAYASAIMVENMLDVEAEEGIGAFIDKRQPHWPR